MSEPQSDDRSYVLITAARNEELHIERLIRCIANQTRLPLRWIIVDDGSSDRTRALVERHAAAHAFIQLLHLQRPHTKDFASKAHALNAAAQILRTQNYAFVGHMDADISIAPTYIECLLDKFGANPRLGLAGGVIYERHRGGFGPRPSNSLRSVAGAVQMFRRECYESLGCVLPLKHGGEDWHAEIMARMGGWEVCAFADLPVYHHRPWGSNWDAVRSWSRQGLMDYSLGSHPMFEVLKLMRRLRMRPFVVGALVRLGGFVYASCRRARRDVPDEVVRFLRAEQMNRLIGFRKIQRKTG